MCQVLLGKIITESRRNGATMCKMAVNTCETIRSNRRIQQLVTLNRDELNVKSHESSLAGLLEAAFALASLANSHDNLQVFIVPTC